MGQALRLMAKMISIKKQHWPLTLLLALSVVWSCYYLVDGAWNDYGRTKPEWLLLIDGLLVLPLLCFYCIDDKRQAALKALIYASLMVLLGSYLIPDANKQLWHYLEAGRYVVLALFVVFELTTLLTVLFAIKSSLDHSSDPDLAISQPIDKLLGAGKLSALMTFEARAWVYALFYRRIEVSRFRGTQHFYGHLKDGTQSNLSGFILLIVFEIPLAHLLLHFIWSPFAANVITALTVFGLLFMVAEYRAISRRPVSLDLHNQQLIIRYGLYAPLILPLEHIQTIGAHHEAVYRAKNTRRYNLFGTPNVAISTTTGTQIYLGLNQPTALIDAVNEHINA